MVMIENGRLTIRWCFNVRYTGILLTLSVTRFAHRARTYLLVANYLRSNCCGVYVVATRKVRSRTCVLST